VSSTSSQITKWVNDQNWGLSLGATLNLRQSLTTFDDRGRPFKIWLTDHDIDKSVKHFANLINRSMFGNNWRRSDRRIAIFPIKEKSNRHHVHLRLKVPTSRPTNLTDLKRQSDEIKRLQIAIRDCWKKLDWGYGSDCISFADNGWTEYQTKSRSKLNVPDSVIWDATSLPV
jgi:hypothetical protein